MKTWALVRDGVVENTFLWDGEGEYQHDAGTIVVEYDESNIAGPGYLYDGANFSRPPLTEQQQEDLTQAKIQSNVAMKKMLMDDASQRIDVLQDAVDLDMATDEERTQLTTLKKYRVLLSRVDTSKAPDIEWPVSP